MCRTNFAKSDNHFEEGWIFISAGAVVLVGPKVTKIGFVTERLQERFLTRYTCIA